MQYMHSKSRQHSEVSVHGLERDLSGLYSELAGYLQLLKESKERHDETKSRRESAHKSGIRSKVLKPSPAKHGLREIPLSSKIKDKEELLQMKEGESSEPPSPRDQKTSKMRDRTSSKVKPP